MRLELMLGVRYLKNKKKFSFVSIITILCVVGILVGDMVMITVLSVMNGFQDDIRDKILGIRSHINISAYSDRPLYRYDEVLETARENSEVISAYSYITIPAIMKGEGFTTLITARSFDDKIFDEDKEFAKYFNFLEGSNSLSEKNNVLIGSEMATDYNLEIGDSFDIITGSGNFERGFRPSKETFIISGIYKTGYYEYDSKMAIIPMNVASSMAGYENAVSGISIKIKNFLIAEKVSEQLNDKLTQYLAVIPWMNFDRNFFAALKTEKIMLGLILSFIILIASFNIASSQIIFVKDKRRDIAILKTLGLKPFRVARVFFLEGAIIGLVGTILGVLAGVLLSFYVNEFLYLIHSTMQVFVNIFYFFARILNQGLITPIIPEFFPDNIYYISGGLPSIIKLEQVILVASISFFMSVIFAIIPAYIATVYKPAEVLRYE